MPRGKLTPAVQTVATKHFGRPITLAELRLIPYVQFLAVNDQSVDLRKVNEEERAILRMWKDEGRCVVGITEFSLTKPFWDALCEILWVAYYEQQFEE